MDDNQDIATQEQVQEQEPDQAPAQEQQEDIDFEYLGPNVDEEQLMAETEEAEPEPDEERVAEDTPTQAPDRLGEMLNEKFGVSSMDELMSKWQEYQQSSDKKGLQDDLSLGEYLDHVESVYGNHAISAYLDAKSTSIDDLSLEDVHRRKLAAEHPSYTPDMIERIRREEMRTRYRQGSEDEDDVAFGRKLLEADMAQVKEELKKKNEEFLAQAVQAPDDKAAAEYEKWKNYVDSHQATQGITRSAQVDIPVGKDEVYRLTLSDKDEIIEMAKDNNKFWDLFKDYDNNTVDLKSAYLTFQIAKMGPEKFISNVYSAGRSAGTSQVSKKIKNASLGSSATPVDDSDDFLSSFMQSLENMK